MGALSTGQVTRRDLLRWGIFTAGGALLEVRGLSPFARSAYADVPTGTPASPLPPGIAFDQPMPRLAELERKPVGALAPYPTCVSLVYTRCAKVCGLMTANLARVQRELGGRVGKDIHFYSVTLEPEHDTPATLAAYAAAYKVGPGWTFLTGRPADVALLRRKFGDLAPIEDHAPRVHVGNDRSGTWWSTAAVDDPKYLATVIGGWMDPSFDGAARVAARGYAGAPPVLAAPRGQATFRQKCAACHVPGGESVGPDLRGAVARRGVAWLRRWLAAPDRMIAERDPVALELLARHGGVPMPNLGLGPADIDDLVAFMKAADEAEGEDARAAGAAAAPAAVE